MPIDDNGFLGKEALRLSEQIIERHDALFDYCHEVNRFAQKLKIELVIHKEYPQQLFAATFFIRVLESAQAAVVLVERGFELEALTILRSAFESLNYLICTAEDDQFVYDYIDFAQTKNRDELKNVLDSKIYEKDKRFGGELGIKKMISDIDAGFEKKGIKIGNLKKKFQKKEIAKKANLLKWYASFYIISSDAAHTGMGALSKHIKTDGHENISDIIHGATDEDAIMHLTAVAEFILTASAHICELFKIDKKQDIKALHEKLKEVKLAV